MQLKFPVCGSETFYSSYATLEHPQLYLFLFSPGPFPIFCGSEIDPVAK
jgi:hypothetical protein